MSVIASRGSMPVSPKPSMAPERGLRARWWYAIISTMASPAVFGLRPSYLDPHRNAQGTGRELSGEQVRRERKA